ncbi:CGL13 [Auxenochlorella protothecoides x Auxenochlorella symbiontica]
MRPVLLLVMLTAAQAVICRASLETNPSDEQCAAWIAAYRADHPVLDKQALNGTRPSQVYFMHIPRTGGKTCFSCFLKSAVPPSQRCLKAYDGPRLALSSPSCGLISSHDDYSLVDSLQPGVAVVTQLRDPTSRVISAYEFAVSVAAESLGAGGEGPSLQAPEHLNYVNTMEVWPWSILIPWFRRNMQARLEGLRKEATRDGTTTWLKFKTRKGQVYWWNRSTNATSLTAPTPMATLEPYSNPLVMPLAEWIEHPIARELVHEGATLQLLGISNVSRWGGEATRLRRCFHAHAPARAELAALAARRLDGLAGAGTLEQLHASVEAHADALGISLEGPAYRNPDEWTWSFDPVEGADLDARLTVRFPARAGVSAPSAPSTMTLREARRHLMSLHESLIAAREAQALLQPRLAYILKAEEEWLGVAPGRTLAASPLGQEIAALDAVLAKKQEEVERLTARLEALRAAGVIASLAEAQGPSVQVVPDRHFLLPEPLGPAFVRCARVSVGRGA